MKSAQPPAVATWLLNHFYCGPRNDALVGDLQEEYALRRSRGWYWSQVLAAIAVSFGRALYTHPIIALRALVLAWAMFLLARRLPILAFLVRSLRPAGHPFTFTLFMASWVVGMILWNAMLLGTGWIIARFHRPHRTAMILLVALSFLSYDLMDIPRICTLVLDSFSNTRYLPYLAIDVFGVVFTPISVWIGGSLTARHEKDTSAQDPQLSA